MPLQAENPSPVLETQARDGAGEQLFIGPGDEFLPAPVLHQELRRMLYAQLAGLFRVLAGVGEYQFRGGMLLPVFVHKLADGGPLYGMIGNEGRDAQGAVQALQQGPALGMQLVAAALAPVPLDVVTLAQVEDQAQGDQGEQGQQAVAQLHSPPPRRQTLWVVSPRAAAVMAMK